MNKLVFVLGFTFLLFAGCETKYYTVLITNGSTRPVAYIYNDSWDILVPPASKTYYEVKPYTLPPIIFNEILKIRVKTEYNAVTGAYTFKDAEFFNLIVNNQLTRDVKIKAGNYIDDDGSVECTIGSSSSRTAKIYTSTPKFTSVSDSTISDPPISITWFFSNINTISVIIK